jgi:hypothetical protein
LLHSIANWVKEEGEAKLLDRAKSRGRKVSIVLTVEKDKERKRGDIKESPHKKLMSDLESKKRAEEKNRPDIPEIIEEYEEYHKAILAKDVAKAKVEHAKKAGKVLKPKKKSKTSSSL